MDLYAVSVNRSSQNHTCSWSAIELQKSKSYRMKTHDENFTRSFSDASGITTLSFISLKYFSKVNILSWERGSKKVEEQE